LWIAEELGVHASTVARYLHETRCEAQSPSAAHPAAARGPRDKAVRPRLAKVGASRPDRRRSAVPGVIEPVLPRGLFQSAGR
jgi:hypothetical protein